MNHSITTSILLAALIVPLTGCTVRCTVKQVHGILDETEYYDARGQVCGYYYPYDRTYSAWHKWSTVTQEFMDESSAKNWVEKVCKNGGSK